MGCKDTLSAYIDADVKDSVERYEERRGHEQTSEAVEELLEIALQETQAPLLYRIKQQAKDAAFYLTLTACVVAIVGLTTDLIAGGTAIQTSIILLAVGVCPIASSEGARLLLVRARGDRQ